MLLWGRDELPLREILNNYRANRSVRDDFIFVRTDAEAKAALSDPERSMNIFFINRLPAEAKAFLEANVALLDDLKIIVPGPYLHGFDKVTISTFGIEPYYFVEPMQALIDMPGFLEHKLLAAQKVNKR